MRNLTSWRSRPLRAVPASPSPTRDRTPAAPARPLPLPPAPAPPRPHRRAPRRPRRQQRHVELRPARSSSPLPRASACRALGPDTTRGSPRSPSHPGLAAGRQISKVAEAGVAPHRGRGLVALRRGNFSASERFAGLAGPVAPRSHESSRIMRGDSGESRLGSSGASAGGLTEPGASAAGFTCSAPARRWRIRGRIKILSAPHHPGGGPAGSVPKTSVLDTHRPHPQARGRRACPTSTISSRSGDLIVADHKRRSENVAGRPSEKAFLLKTDRPAA